MGKYVIRCQDCYNKFVFTEKQQEFYSTNAWEPPIRCPICRARKKEIYIIHQQYQNQLNNKEKY